MTSLAGLALVLLSYSMSTAPNGSRQAASHKDHRGVDLISDVLPFGHLWYDCPNAISNAIGYAQHRSRSHDAVIHVYDAADNVIDTHQHNRNFKEP